VNLAVAVRPQRPLPRPGQVTDDLDLEVVGRIDDDLGGRPQRVGQLALEVLLGRHALAGRLVPIDLDVDRLPPVGIGAAVGERVEDRILRRIYVPLVQERVLLGHLSSGVGAGPTSPSTIVWITTSH